MNRPTPALVVDADPRGLEALAYGFQGEGWQPTPVPDYAGAHDAAVRTTPQLAVVAVREPSGPGLTALRDLRASGTPLPVLVLGPESLRNEVRALSADFLAMPAFIRDVLTASKLLTAVQQASGRTDDEAGMTGSLSEYGFFYLLRAMVGLGRSGILQVERANRRGEIRFSDGEVTGATAGSLSGMAALHHLLLWEEAAIDLKLRPTVHRSALHQRPEEVVEECERFLRDFAHATKDLGPTNTVLRADLDKAANAGDTVPAEVGPLVRLFDGKRPLGEVLEESPFRVFDTLRIVSRLVDLAILVRVETAPPARPSSTPTIKILPDPLPAPVVPGPASEPPRAAQPERTPPPSKTPSPKDQRTGTPNRRKLPRRERGNLEQRNLNRTPPPLASPVSDHSPAGGAAAAPEAKPIEATPAAPSTASGQLRTSGTIGAARGELRSAPREVSRPADAPSVVIDMGGADPAAPAPAAPAVSGTTSRHATGVMEARPSAAQPTASSGFSIQVDPDLMAEMADHEAARPTPPPVLVPAPAAAPAPTPAAVRNGTPAASPAKEPTPPPHTEAGKRALRPSSEFDALERDFFAREADLYKQEHPESFDDLDHGKGRKIR
jgi:ActR/RegA family two-component response regulator